METVFTGVWRDFSRTWPKLITADIVYKLIAFVIVTPILGGALRAFVSLSGESVLTDQDILFFVLSPVGILALIVVAALSIGIAGIEGAALMTIGFGAVRNTEIGVAEALWISVRRLPSILGLTIRLVVRVLLLAAPFLAAGGLVYLWLLTEHDINYYLSEKPSTLYLAAGLIGVILVALAIVLLAKIVGWSYALPLHLFENVGAGAALATSAERTRGHRPTVALVLVTWAVLSLLIGALALGAVGGLGRFLVPKVQSSMGTLLLVMGTLFVLGSVINWLMTLVQSAFLALLTTRLYDRFGRSEEAVLPTSSSGELAGAASLSVSPRAILSGLLVVALVAGGVGYYWVQGVRTDDDVLVTAHRGAAGRAPENTLASITAALEDGADIVEIDVQETKDGQVVVLHDSDFMRIAGVRSKIWDVSYDEIKDIDVGSWYAPEFSSERIATLAEVLYLVKGKGRVDIELKYYGHDERLEERVVEIVETAGMASDVLVMSLHRNGIRRIRQLRPSWTVGLLTAKAVGDLTRVDVDFLAVHSGMATPRFVRTAHAAGKDVFVWTVNDPVHMSTMMSRGVDSLITDEPALAKSVIARRAELSSLERLLLDAAFYLGAVPKEPPAEVDTGP